MKDLAKKRDESLGSGNSLKENDGASGFSLTALLLIAVAFMIIGALLGKY